MTKETFIYGLNACAVTYHNGQKFYEHDELVKCFEDLGIFEQEPCDTVSRGVFEQVMWERDVAIEQLKELGYGLGEKPRTGHWIMTGDYLTTDYSSTEYVKCSCCHVDSLEEGNYCPNCGAKMTVSEGRE